MRTAFGPISGLVALTSLNLALVLFQDYAVVAKTWAITAATISTPIVVTSPAHGVPLGRVVHGIVSGAEGMTEANGLWILTPLDENTFSLTTLDAQGIVVPSVGANAYTGGGQIQTPFPEWSILLGRRNLMMAGAVASPRFVFIPTTGRGWNFEPYVGAAPNLTPATYPPARGSAQQQVMKLQPQFGTEYTTFEVWVFGCATNFGATTPDPDYADFDATQALAFALVGVLFDELGGGFRILHEDWPSQMPESGVVTQRGQIWRGLFEFQQTATKAPGVPNQFAPIGVSAAMVVEPVNPGSGDPITITIT